MFSQNQVLVKQQTKNTEQKNQPDHLLIIKLNPFR